MSFNSSIDESNDANNQNMSTLEDSNFFQNENKINKALLNAISKTLNQVIAENQALKNYSRKVKEQSHMVFSARTPPQISLYDYLYRIKYYGEMEDNTLIVALIYIDRLCDMTSLTLTPYNIHRILFASIVTAIKYTLDLFYDNKYYSEIAGVSLKELCKIEESFVDLMEFNFYVEKNHFEKYQKYLKTIENKSK